MGDRTLVDTEIEQWAKASGLVEPFSAGQVRECFYDFRVGSKVIYAHPDGYIHVELAEGGEFTLRPGDMCTVFSLEKVNMPLDMKGRLSLRGRVANRQIVYSGGPVSPGYRGHLFFTLVNMGSAPVKIHQGQGIVTCEFIKLARAVSVGYADQVFLDIPPYRLPSLPERKLHDWAEVTRKIDDLESKYAETRHDAKVSRSLTETVFFAVVAGLIAALAYGETQLLLAPLARKVVGG